jgi:CRISPR-associated protein Cas2
LKKKKLEHSDYKAVWIFAMFDLPMTTEKARKRYTRFRKSLLRQGFMMLQFSIYARFCRSDERAEALRSRLRKVLPPEGQVRILSVTDHQYKKMEIFHGKSKSKAESPPEQLLLF